MSLHSGHAGRFSFASGAYMVWLPGCSVAAPFDVDTLFVGGNEDGCASAGKRRFADGMTAADAKDPKLGQDWVRLDYDSTRRSAGNANRHRALHASADPASKNASGASRFDRRRAYRRSGVLPEIE